jgi:NAD(P)-dependent dehydrogenase (short-subunit alcohol dehydrogenase family)
MSIRAKGTQVMTDASRDERTAVKQVRRTAAITGAGSGLGRDIALGLAEKGYEVFGTVTKDADLQIADGRIRLSLCDIAKEQDVKVWAGSVSAALGDGRGLAGC